jgi:hydrogenase expression/formation protein HypC
VGDYVVVHVGFALSRLEPEEAAETLALLQELAQAGEYQPTEVLAPPAPMGG